MKTIIELLDSMEHHVEELADASRDGKIGRGDCIDVVEKYVKTTMWEIWNAVKADATEKQKNNFKKFQGLKIT